MLNDIAAGSTIYLDTNVVIYFIEGWSRFHARARRLVEQSREIGAHLVTSELTIAECLYRPYRDNDRQLISLYQAAFASNLISLYPLTGDLAIRAAEAAGSLRLKLFDAIHYISALEAGCDSLVTADRKFRSAGSIDVLAL